MIERVQAMASRFRDWGHRVAEAIAGSSIPIAAGAPWSYSEAGRSFTGTSTSESPLILGVTIEQLPARSKPVLALADDEPGAEALGDAYRFEAGAGDLLAQGVTEAQALALGAQSWIPRRSLEQAAVVTRHAHDVRVVALHGDPVLVDGIASIDFNGTQLTQLTQLRAGVFAVNKPIPKVGAAYQVSGTYDEGNLPFSFGLTCTHAGRPISTFAR
uniref:hypothetical protein n=1 Tax=Burkholderia sp. AU33423 TaxID=2015355 RepID=UPI0011800C29|nr:hypothetical protein [Burkholderia sp. AU33423]